MSRDHGGGVLTAAAPATLHCSVVTGAHRSTERTERHVTGGDLQLRGEWMQLPYTTMVLILYVLVSHRKPKLLPHSAQMTSPCLL